MTESTPSDTPDVPAHETWAEPEGTEVATPTDSAIVTPVEPDPPAADATTAPSSGPGEVPPAAGTGNDTAPAVNEPPADPVDPTVPAAVDAKTGEDLTPVTPEVPDTQETPTDKAGAPAGGTQFEPAPLPAPADPETPPSSDVPAEHTDQEPVTGEGQDTVGQARVELPDAPVIEVPADGESSDDPMVHVSGTASPAGATVTVWADSRAIGKASIDDTENWSLEANLPNGVYVLTASTDNLGRVGQASAKVEITVNHDPQAPIIPASDDPEERFVAFLQARVLRGYPLNWELISQLRAHAQAWLDSRSSTPAEPAPAAEPVKT